MTKDEARDFLVADSIANNAMAWIKAGHSHQRFNQSAAHYAAATVSVLKPGSQLATVKLAVNTLFPDGVWA